VKEWVIGWDIYLLQARRRKTGRVSLLHSIEPARLLLHHVSSCSSLSEGIASDAQGQTNVGLTWLTTPFRTHACCNAKADSLVKRPITEASIAMTREIIHSLVFRLSSRGVNTQPC